MSTRRRTPQGTNEGAGEAIVLRLYVAGSAPNSTQAIANIEAIRRESLDRACELEIIDVLEHPQRAMAEGILVTPTLLKLHPQPTAQVVGNLSDRTRVLLAIGVGSDAT